MSKREPIDKPVPEATRTTREPAAPGVEIREILGRHAPRTSLAHRVFENERLWVNAVAFTPDGSSICVRYPSRLALWNLQTGRCLWSYPALAWDSSPLGFTPDGEGLLIDGPDHAVEWIDLSSGRCIRRFRLGHQERIQALGATPDGKTLVTASNRVMLWDMGTGRPVRTVEGHRNMVKAIALTKDGRYLLTGGLDRTVRLYGLPGGECLWISDEHESPVTAVAAFPDGRGVLSGTHHGMLRILDPLTGKSSFETKGEGSEICAVRVSPEGTRLFILYRDYAVGYNYPGGVVERLDLGNGTRQVLAHSVRSLDLSPDGMRLALGKNMHVSKVWVNIMEVSSGKPVREVGHVTDPVYKVALSPGGDRLVIRGGGESPLKIWDLRSGRCVRDYPAREEITGYTNFAFMPDGERILLSLNNNSVTIAELATGRPLRSFSVDSNCTFRMAVTPDCRDLVTLGENKLVRWDLQTGRRQQTLYPGFHYSPRALAVTEDGKRIVAAYERDGIRLYDLVSGRLLKTLGSPDLRVMHLFLLPGRPHVVASDTQGKTQVFHMETGECLRTYDWNVSSIDSAALSGNGRVLVNHNLNTGLWVRDLSTGQCLLHFKASSQLGGVALGERHIITGTQDHRIRFWDLESGSLCATLFNVTHGFLWVTPAEEGDQRGWLWTDREDLILVVECGEDGEIRRFLPENDPARRSYLRVRNNRKMVMARLRNPEEYRALAAEHHAVVQGEVLRRRHEVVAMLPDASSPL